MATVPISRPHVTPPCWVYYFHGRAVVVQTEAELAALLPGYANVSGPWCVIGQDGLERIITIDDLPWDANRGPFAPEHMWHQYGSPRVLGSLLIYATTPLIYASVARARGELFWLTDELDDNRRLQVGDIARPQSLTSVVRHESTGRYFLNARCRDAYAQLYEAGDVTGWGVSLASTAKPASAKRARVSSITPPKAIRQTRKSYYDGPTLEAEIKDIYPTLAHDNGGYVPLWMMAQNLTTQVHERTLGRYLNKYKISYPPK